MKAKELSVGDYVYGVEIEGSEDQAYGQKTYYPIQIKAIYGETIMDNYGMERGIEDDLEPIPLTDEILEKNFPEYERGYTIGWWPNEVGYQIEWSGDVEDNEIILQHVQYVHQLQHILRLVGYEKEIAL